MASTDYATNGASGQKNDLNNEDTHDSVMQKIRTAGSVSIPPDVFEKLYLTPQDAAVKGGLRKTLGNPTPLGLAGFLLSLTPLSCDLMNWRAAGSGNGSSDIPVYMFFGGILMNIAAIFELILGNTYIATVFGTFGCFWLSYGSILDPTFSAYGNYDPGNPAKGLDTVPFNAALGFFLLFMGLLCLIYLIGALRTNVVLVLILFPLPFAFGLLAATFWYTAESYDTGSASLAAYANTLKVTAGAFTFATDMFGWYLFAALILAALDFPISLPVGDLSTKIKGATEKYADQV